MKDNMLNILSSLNASDTTNEVVTESAKKTDSVLSVLNELAAVDNAEVVTVDANANVVKDAVIEEENDAVVLCTKCNSMVLKSEVVEGKCPVCGEESEYIEIGVVAPEGADNINDVNSDSDLSDNEALITNESVEVDSEEEEEDELVEATKKVIRNGEVVKVKIKTRKAKMSAGQKAALKKARKKANTASAKKARKKSLKVRSRKINEASTTEYFFIRYSRKGLIPDHTGDYKNWKELMKSLEYTLKIAGLTGRVKPSTDVDSWSGDDLVICIKGEATARRALKGLAEVALIDKKYESANGKDILLIGPVMDPEDDDEIAVAPVEGLAPRGKRGVLSKEDKANGKTARTTVESITLGNEDGELETLDEKGMGTVAKIIDAIGRAAKTLKKELSKEIDADKEFAKVIDKALNDAYKVIASKAPKVATESLKLPSELLLSESIGLAIVSDMPTELETIAKELGFELAEGCYVRVVEGITLVLDASEGDVEGVVIYGVDATGETLSEEALAGVLAVAGIEFEVEDDQLEEACKKKAKNESDDLEDEEEDLEETKEKKRRCNSKNESVVVNESFKYSEVIKHPKLVKLGANQIKKLDLNGEDGTCGVCEYQLSVENADKVLKSLKIDMDNPEVMVAYVCYDCGATYLTQDAGNDFYVYKVK